jgi:hypothetical protein
MRYVRHAITAAIYLLLDTWPMKWDWPHGHVAIRFRHPCEKSRIYIHNNKYNNAMPDLSSIHLLIYLG